MSENIYAVSGLKRKRAELAGQVLIVQEQLRSLRVDIAAVDRALGLLDPTVEPKAIKPLKPTKRYKYFEAGEMGRLLLDELRKASGKPVSIPAMAKAVMAVKGLDVAHIDAYRAVAHRVTMQLHSLHRRGVIEKIGSRSGVTWRLRSE